MKFRNACFFLAILGLTIMISSCGLETYTYIQEVPSSAVGQLSSNQSLPSSNCSFIYDMSTPTATSASMQGFVVYYRICQYTAGSSPDAVPVSDIAMIDTMNSSDSSGTVSYSGLDELTKLKSLGYLPLLFSTGESVDTDSQDDYRLSITPSDTSAIIKVSFTLTTRAGATPQNPDLPLVSITKNSTGDSISSFTPVYMHRNMGTLSGNTSSSRTYDFFNILANDPDNPNNYVLLANNNGQYYLNLFVFVIGVDSSESLVYSKATSLGYKYMVTN
jgi:hypothetical protein